MAFLGPSLRRTKVHDRPGRRLALAALASLAVNGVALFLLARAGAFDAAKPLAKQDVSMAPLSAEQWSANRAVRTPNAMPAPLDKAPPPAAPPKVKPPDSADQTPPKQVVDVAPSKDRRPPENPRYLSEQDNRVEKETRSRLQGAGNFHNRAPTVVPGQAEKRKAGAAGAADETRQAKEAQRGTNQAGGKGKREEEPRPETKDERLALLDHPSLPKVSPAPRPGAGEEGVGVPGAPGTPEQGKLKSGDPRLLPSIDSMSKITAGPSNDYIDRDVPEGEETALNTKGFRFATFWNRFKQDVADQWRPMVVYQERDPRGTIYARRPEYVTGLRVVLDPTGAVKRLEVVEPSGLDFLDREAIRAIRAASPFYNVPTGLVDAKGEVSFSFGMALIMNRAVPIRPHQD